MTSLEQGNREQAAARSGVANVLAAMAPIDPISVHHTGLLANYSSEELTMLEMARRWVPFGGVPEEDILVAFGMSNDSFDATVRRLVRELRRPNAHRCMNDDQEIADDAASSKV
ncbi:hypothetical protein XU06_29450 (plasmid) [Rhodococcus erythropolis]|nr:hypothetical protein XU06_29450 [Rhodococcus erythropolis]